MSILLIGYRGTGKTTVSKELGERLGWSVLDADDEIERRAGKTIAQIFQQDGEEQFREMESAVIDALAGKSSTVMSLGGGAILREKNRSAIGSLGQVIWLQASPQTIAARLATDATTAERRPNLTTVGGMPEIERLLAERLPLYRECADHVVDTEGKTPQQITDEILRLTGLP